MYTVQMEKECGCFKKSEYTNHLNMNMFILKYV